MIGGWRYRAISVLGVTLLAAIALHLANHSIPQWVVTTHVPLFSRLEPTVLDGQHLLVMTGLSTAIVVLLLVPLYKPRPRRMLDTIVMAQKRVIVAGLTLATIGFFKWSHRLPRATLTIFVTILLITIPLWFVQIRRRPNGNMDRALLVGDDLEQMRRIAAEPSLPIVGYLCPTSMAGSTGGWADRRATAVADGGLAAEGGPIQSLDRIGGLSRIEDVLVDRDIDTVILAFRAADRGEFFGILAACHENGVAAKVHREYADSVLTAGDAVGTLVDVKIEPWDPQDYFLKRTFDVIFAATGLIVLAPLIVCIAVAIKLDDGGPILYKQERRAGFGDAFQIYKFRTMTPAGESAVPVEDEENDRITAVGHILRSTHMDEIPQLWPVLLGRMSVVGPRAVWTDEEELLEREATSWRKRWFVKPGLTGLAQVNDIKSTEPDAKLRYDLQYIRRQSFWFDVRLVLRQLWLVARDLWKTIQS